MEKEKKLTLKQFEKDVLKVNGTQKIEEAEQIGVLLLASIQEGVDNDKLEAFTHYPWPVVKKRQNG